MKILNILTLLITILIFDHTYSAPISLTENSQQMPELESLLSNLIPHVLEDADKTPKSEEPFFLGNNNLANFPKSTTTLSMEIHAEPNPKEDKFAMLNFMKQLLRRQNEGTETLTEPFQELNKGPLNLAESTPEAPQENLEDETDKLNGLPVLANFRKMPTLADFNVFFKRPSGIMEQEGMPTEVETGTEKELAITSPTIRTRRMRVIIAS